MPPQQDAPTAEPLAVADTNPDALTDTVRAVDATDTDISARLERLANLHRQGVLDDDELAAAKRLLLQRPTSRGTVVRIRTRRRALPEVHPVDATLSLTAVVLEVVAARLEDHVDARRASREANRLNRLNQPSQEGIR